MTAPIKVLGCVAEWSGVGYEARTPLGIVGIVRLAGEAERWAVQWWPKRQRCMSVEISVGEPSPTDAAREATRRLRAIQRTCARAGAV